MKVENKIALALNLDCEKRTIICSSFGCFSQEWSLLHNGIQTPEQKPFVYKESTIRPWSNIKGRGRKSYHSIDSKLSNASIQKNCLPGSLQHQIIQNKLFWMFCLLRTNGKILINLWSWFDRRHHFRHWKACNKWLVFWDVKALILFVVLRNLLCKLIHKHAFLVESPARVALHCTILLTDNTCSPKASYSNHAVQHKDINEMPSKKPPSPTASKDSLFSALQIQKLSKHCHSKFHSCALSQHVDVMEVAAYNDHRPKRVNPCTFKLPQDSKPKKIQLQIYLNQYPTIKSL